MTDIPDDIKTIANTLAMTGCGCDEDASQECPNMDGHCRHQENQIARAILDAEARGAEKNREACAQIADIAGAHWLAKMLRDQNGL